MPVLGRKTLADVDLSGKKVLCRVDFNVPMEDGKITDDTRIRAVLPTLEALSDTVLVLCSHLGRPKGKRKPELSLRPAAERLGELLGRPVRFVEDCIGERVASAVAEMKPGDIALLENTRFYPGEESKDEAENRAFAEQLAAPFEAYVNDAFGAAHRKHASSYTVATLLSPAVAGLLMEKELDQLGRLLEQPKEGFVAIIGGAKVEDKLGVVEKLLEKAERVLVGGAMAWAFLKARHYEIGASLCTDASLEAAREFYAKAARGEIDISGLMLPTDCHMRQVWGSGKQHKKVPVTMIRPGWSALDIGPATIETYSSLARSAATVFWNGPMGWFEHPPYNEGTFALAHAVAECSGFTVIGGGDSVAAIEQAGVADKVSHVSTGGGASLEFVEFGTLPGVEALDPA
ncbi:MAG: phosphoglycerate kinase [Armatimonadetes bacterium]|nr:phosphoglycerate kinase [Armatimonadota bacterium]